MSNCDGFDERKLAEALKAHFKGNIAEVLRVAPIARDTFKRILEGKPTRSGVKLVAAAKKYLTTGALAACRSVMPTRPLWVPARYEYNLAEGPQFDPKQRPDEMDLPAGEYELWGYKLDSPFGASASCITTDSRWVRVLLDCGCSVVTRKTVRTRRTRAHDLPTNLGWVMSPQNILQPLPFNKLPKMVYATMHWEKLTPHQRWLLVNCFGIPSPDPENWRPDLEFTMDGVRAGQLIVQSVVGTVPETEQAQDRNGDQLVEDFARAVELIVGMNNPPHAVELNLSCPHVVGNEGTVYRNAKLTGRVCKIAREAIEASSNPRVRLLAKIAYIDRNGNVDTSQLDRLCEESLEYIDGFSCINTVPVVVHKKPEAGGRETAFFDYEKRFEKAGISGIIIQRCALEMIESMRKAYDRAGVRNKVIFGMGGVTEPEDVGRFLDAGADIVQATTIFLHRPAFAADVRRHLICKLSSPDLEMLNRKKCRDRDANEALQRLLSSPDQAKQIKAREYAELHEKLARQILD